MRTMMKVKFRCWKAWKPSGKGLVCTLVPQGQTDCIIWSTKLSTTQSTRRWHATVPVSYTHLMGLIELHQLFLLFFLIFFVFFLNFLNFWLEYRHLCRCFLLFNRKWEHQRFYQNGKYNQNDSVILNHRIQQPHNPSQWNAD